MRSASTNAADSFTQSTSWRQDNGLAHSSPALSRSGHAGFDTATLPHPQEDSPMFDVHSDDEDTHVFAQEPASSIISSSPPEPHLQLDASTAIPSILVPTFSSI